MRRTALLILSFSSLAFAQTVTSTPNPSQVGQTVTMTITLGGKNSAAPVVEVYDVTNSANPVNLGTAIFVRYLAPNYTYTLQYAFTTAGDHQLQACIESVDGPCPLSGTKETQTVIAPQTPISLTSSPNPSTFGAAVTFTATTTRNATGTVTFTDTTGGTTLGTQPMVPNCTGTCSFFSSAASLTTSVLGAGVHSVTASYGGDSIGGPGTSRTTQMVNRAATQTVLTTSSNPSTQGQPLTLKATLSSSGATGLVTFLDNGNQLGSVSLVGGVATYTTLSLTQGNHTLMANYAGDSNYLSSSSSTSQQVAAPPSVSTALTLNSSPNPSVLCQPVKLNATVTPSNATGTVSFYDGTAQLTAIPVVSGSASYSISNLAIGTHTLQARYNPDPGFNASSQQTAQSVSGAVTVTLSSSPNPSTQGGNVVISAAVSPTSCAGAPAPSAPPSGLVTFFDGSVQLGAGNVGAGVATYQTPNLALGTHSLGARYGGDAEYGAATANSITQTVGPRTLTPTTTLLSTSANPVAITQPLTLTANVTPAGATGQVEFFDGITSLGSKALSNGAATLSLPSLSPAGTHQLTATYGGDSNFGSGTSNTLMETVIVPSSSVLLSASPNPANAGQPVTLTATVNPSAATGTVQFLDGANLLGQGSLSNGSASTTFPGFTAGPHALTAKYLGDGVNPANTSNSVTLAVSKQNTLTSLTTSGTSVAAGQSVTLSAQVLPSGATGEVQFLEGNNVLGAVNLTSGTAKYSTSNLSAGAHSIIASYQGDANYNQSSSQAASITVTPTPGQSSVSLVVTPTTVNVGQTVTMTATVDPSSATGTITFDDNGHALTSVALNNGVASYQTPTLSAGPHTITASYSGSNSVPPSNSNQATVTVNSISTNTQTTLSTSPNSSTYGQTVVLAATVAAVNGGAPSGVVSFSDGSDVLGTASLTGGSATLPVSTLTAGPHALVASYSGVRPFNSSSSPPVNLQVSKATTFTTLTATPSAPSAGQPVTLSARVTSSATGVITGAVTFMDGTSAVGGPVQLSAGSASTTLPSLPAGSHSFTAVYSGDSNFLSSTSSPVTGSSGQTTTAINLSVTPSSSTFGEKVTLTATVNSAAATGTVSFLDGAATLSTQPLANGSATYTTANLSPGAHSLTAVYSGDAKYLTSTSSAFTETVAKQNSTIVLTVNPNSESTTTTVTLRATVTPVTATGIVSFLEGNTTLGAATLSNGIATFATPFPSGNHTLVASYAGDTNVAPSMSAAVTETISVSATLGNISPASLPVAIVGAPYSQAFTVVGGVAPFTWTLVSGSAPGLSLSPDGVLSGIPASALTVTLNIRVQDSNGGVTAVAPTLTVLPLPSLSLTAPTVSSTADQPAAQLSISPAYALPLTATFALSFTPDAADLPPDYVNPDVKFITGSARSAPVDVPANTNASLLLPALQIGSVAGTITVTLATLVTSSGQSVLPGTPPTASIVVGRYPPMIVPGSVNITNISSSGFSVVLDGLSTPRDLTSASFTFTAAAGTQLTGAQETVSLTSASTAWFADTRANGGVANGGMFSLAVPFNYSGDTSAISGVSVILTNSAGTSAPTSGSK